MHDSTNVTDKSTVCYGHSWVVISLIILDGELLVYCSDGIITFAKTTYNKSTRRNVPNSKQNLK